MTFSRVALLLALSHFAASEQPSAPSPIAAPLRELPWAKGGLNFLHTTDTHGWHGGHLQEAQYAADWGDYVSFAQHLRERADADGSDVLLVDTGDRVEGNGLYDASSPKGQYTYDIFRHQHLDVITTGNHELYLRNTSRREYDEMVPDYKDAYIASNVDVWDSKAKDDNGAWTAMAPRYRIITTKNLKLRVLTFGFLYDFHGNAPNTRIQDVEETIKEQWFQDAIREKDIDLFLVAGHVPVRGSKEFDAVYNAIRKEKWDAPIVFFGGHTHIRDFKKWEKKAMGIESGRYMETLGFLSIDGLGSKNEGKRGEVSVKKTPEYQRLYIDNNLYSLHHHSGTNGSTFPTQLGLNVSTMIHQARKNLSLDHTYGCAPHDFWLNRAPFPSQDSILSLLGGKILADTFNARSDPAIIVTNSGAIRFDIFKGPFTIDTTFLVSPFISGFRLIKNVDTSIAAQVLSILNNEGPIPLQDLLSFAEADESLSEYRLNDLLAPLPPISKQTLSKRLLQEQAPLDRNERTDASSVPGYTTTDDLGNTGDDTVHQKIQFYDVPNCISTNIHVDPNDKANAPEKVDLIYNEFIQDWVLLALRYLGVRYGKENTRVAAEGKSMTQIISEWVGQHWKCESQDESEIEAGGEVVVGEDLPFTDDEFLRCREKCAEGAGGFAGDEFRRCMERVCMSGTLHTDL